MRLYFSLLVIIFTLIHYAHCMETSYVTTKDLEKQYGSKYHSVFFMHLSELCAKQCDRYAFLTAIEKKSVNCLAYLIKLANKIKAYDLSKQIECYTFIKQLPTDIKSKLYTDEDRKKIAMALSAKVLSLQNVTSFKFANKEHLLYFSPDGLLLSHNSKGDFSFYSDNGTLIKQFKNKEINDNQEHKNGISYVKVFDNNYMVSQGWDGYIKLWDFEKATYIKNIAQDVYCGLFDVNNKEDKEAIIFVENGWLKAWPFDITKEPYNFAYVGSEIKQIHVLDHLDKILCVDHNGMVSSYTLDGTLSSTTMVMPPADHISLDHRKKDLRTENNRMVSIWSTKKEECRGIIRSDFNIEKLIGYTYTSDNHILCKRQLIYNNNNVWVCDAAHSAIKHKIPLYVSPIKEVIVASETPYCFIRDDNEIVMYDTHQGVALRSFNHGTRFIKNMRSYDDNYVNLLLCIAYNNNDHKNDLCIYDYMNGKELIKHHYRSINKILTINNNQFLYALVSFCKHSLHNFMLINPNDFNMIKKITKERALQEAFLIEKRCFDNIVDTKKITDDMNVLLHKDECTFLNKVIQ